ncbi:MAG: polyphosphate:AMP phosphotransferase [Defluviitaleaceae bacterium]|nr:polyphosphate:AMP phosphotransferase [Defluviitaleaceae bacterium]
MIHMLDEIKGVAELNKAEYQERLIELEAKLGRLQIRAIAVGLPIAIHIDGWAAAGKATLIGRALRVLDPRHYRVHGMEKVNEERRMRPFLWSYATKMPAAGQISIFDKSYYMALIPGSEMIRNGEITSAECVFADIKAFEAGLADGGTLILKYFLHIDKKEQTQRLRELLANEDTCWRITEKELRQNIEYDKYYGFYNKIIEASGSGDLGITVLNGNDRRTATLGFYEHITATLERVLDGLERGVAELALSRTKPDVSPKIPDILSKIDLKVNIGDEKYGKQLKSLQNQISSLIFKLYRKRRSVCLVFEGWDAAGKGGSINRLIQSADPRGYNVCPVAAPTKEELSHHYLWRFWKNLPKDGHVTVFDRSWYGRILVERVENLCSEDDWQRAYREINNFEKHLHNHGSIVIKYWLHVSDEEQLKRFEARAQNPDKQHKITDEDWRNRNKRTAYYAAVNEMLHRTGTAEAPWTVIESDSKKYARIKVLEHTVKVLESEL